VSISTISEPATQRSVKAWWKELWVQVMIAMALGVALGIYRPDFATQMQPFGDAFIKAIRMLIAPIIFCTVVNGVARMADMARVGRVAIKSSAPSRSTMSLRRCEDDFWSIEIEC
jgi:aerobic C4-dicarboxylate transport protein